MRSTVLVQRDDVSQWSSGEELANGNRGFACVHRKPALTRSVPHDVAGRALAGRACAGGAGVAQASLTQPMGQRTTDRIRGGLSASGWC